MAGWKAAAVRAMVAAVEAAARAVEAVGAAVARARVESAAVVGEARVESAAHSAGRVRRERAVAAARAVAARAAAAWAAAAWAAVARARVGWAAVEMAMARAAAKAAAVSVEAVAKAMVAGAKVEAAARAAAGWESAAAARAAAVTAAAGEMEPETAAVGWAAAIVVVARAATVAVARATRLYTRSSHPTDPHRATFGVGNCWERLQSTHRIDRLCPHRGWDWECHLHSCAKECMVNCCSNPTCCNTATWAATRVAAPMVVAMAHRAEKMETEEAAACDRRRRICSTQSLAIPASSLESTTCTVCSGW